MILKFIQIKWYSVERQRIRAHRKRIWVDGRRINHNLNGSARCTCARPLLIWTYVFRCVCGVGWEHHCFCRVGKTNWEHPWIWNVRWNISVRNRYLQITAWTIWSASAFSHSGIGLMNILDSRMCQTRCQTCSAPPRRDSRKLGLAIIPNGSQAPWEGFI